VLYFGAGGGAGALPPATAATERTFGFLNHRETIRTIDWHRRYVSHLWTYNLHYFEYAADLASAWAQTGQHAFVDQFIELTDHWITSTSVGTRDGWDPYPTSIRTANWLRAVLAFDDALPHAVRDRVLSSTHAQLRHLARRLEWHLLGNHLLKNLHALALGGLVFDDAAGRMWRERMTDVFWEQLSKQLAADGGHIERSPMYHAIVLGDALELLHLQTACGAPPSREGRECVGRAVAAFVRLSRGDGTLHLFNDAANGIAPGADLLAGQARAAGVEWPADPQGAWSLPNSGFFGFADASTGERFIIDGGPPGPSYQPAHAHCGTLSFELDLGGRPCIVDSGTPGYEGDPLRGYARSTRAHNTVAIGGHEQSEVWGTFRMARRASVPYAGIDAARGGFAFAGACSPYHDRGAVHHRRVERTDRGWRIADHVDGADGAPVIGFIHLHPGFHAVAENGGITARASHAVIRFDVWGADAVRVLDPRDGVEHGYYCPEFGLRLPAPIIELAIERNDGRMFGFEVLRP
jgi:hypothetical protein